MRLAFLSTHPSEKVRDGLPAPRAQVDVAKQIASRLNGLVDMADDAQLGMLAYLLDMARAEAERKAKATHAARWVD